MTIDMYTTDKLPTGMVIKDIFPMIQATSVIQISEKNFIKKFLDRNRNETQEAMDNLKSIAPNEANAILNVKVTSTSQQFSNGVFLYLTYIGTPAIIGQNEA